MWTPCYLYLWVQVHIVLTVYVSGQVKFNSEQKWWPFNKRVVCVNKPLWVCGCGYTHDGNVLSMFSRASRLIRFLRLHKRVRHFNIASNRVKLYTWLLQESIIRGSIERSLVLHSESNVASCLKHAMTIWQKTILLPRGKWRLQALGLVS